MWLEKCDLIKAPEEHKELYKDLKRTIGISIYPDKDSPEKIKNYMELAAKHGVKWAFTNLLSDGTRTKEETIAQFKDIIEHGNKHGINTMLDVAPDVYEMLGLKPTETKLFKELGAKGIRLDQFFGGKVEAEISNNKDGLVLEINASDIRIPDLIDAIKKQGGKMDNLLTCHNFYPQKYTGLSTVLFESISKEIQSRGVKVKAFIHTNNSKSFGPWDVFEGLPTIEECRFIPIDDQLRLYFSTGLVNQLLVSDCYATEEQFKKLGSIDLNVINFRIEPEKDLTEMERNIIFNYPHAARQDMSDYMVRSTFPRITYKKESVPPKNTKKKLVPGDVVVLNDNYGRYKAELHIITKEMDNDGGKNYVGKLAASDLYILNNVKGMLLENKNTFPFLVIE